MHHQLTFMPLLVLFLNFAVVTLNLREKKGFIQSHTVEEPGCEATNIRFPAASTLHEGKWSLRERAGQAWPHKWERWTSRRTLTDLRGSSKDQIWKKHPDCSPLSSHTLGTRGEGPSLPQVGDLVPAQQQPSASLATGGWCSLRPGAGPCDWPDSWAPVSRPTPVPTGFRRSGSWGEALTTHPWAARAVRPPPLSSPGKGLTRSCWVERTPIITNSGPWSFQIASKKL